MYRGLSVPKKRISGWEKKDKLDNSNFHIHVYQDEKKITMRENYTTRTKLTG